MYLHTTSPATTTERVQKVTSKRPSGCAQTVYTYRGTSHIVKTSTRCRGKDTTILTEMVHFSWFSLKTMRTIRFDAKDAKDKLVVQKCQQKKKKMTILFVLLIIVMFVGM